MLRGRWVAILALLCAMIIWGSAFIVTFIVTKILLEESGPFFVTVGRLLIGLAVLLPFAYREGFDFRLALRPRLPPVRSYRRGAILRVSELGAALYFGRQRRSHPGRLPAAAAVLAYLFLNERIPRKRLLGVGLSVLGVLLVSGAMPTGGDPLYLLGNALIVGSVLAYGAYATQGKGFKDRRPVPGDRGHGGELRSGPYLPLALFGG